MPSKTTKLIKQIPQNENRKSAPKNKRNKNDQNKIVTAIVSDSMIKDV